MLGWLILGALLGGIAAAVVYSWDEIKDWISSIAYKIKRSSRMFIRKLKHNSYEMEIEGETKIVSEEEVPPEIRAKSRYSSKTDITQDARQIGILKY